MPTVTFIGPDGSKEDVDVANGMSLMQAAVANGIDSIVGDCGGSAACATCHVYVESHRDLMPPITVDEQEMLGQAVSEVLPQSRLSCQIEMHEEISSLVVRVAPAQW